MDAVLYVRNECTADLGDPACTDDWGPYGVERVPFTRNQGEAALIIVDGYADGQEGSFRVRVSRAEDCGNATVADGEACDDGNTADHDICSASCQVEVTLIEELEPNDDGSPSVSNTLRGNDFLAGAVSQSVSTDALLRGTLTPDGDEDSFWIVNDSAEVRDVLLHTWFGKLGVCIADDAHDTVLVVRDASGNVVHTQDEGDLTMSNCTLEVLANLEAGQGYFVTVLEFDDNAGIPTPWLLSVDFR